MSASAISLFSLVLLSTAPVQPPTVRVCEGHLRAIGGALEAYRREHAALPGRLVDLFPRYVDDRTVFRCPEHPSLSDGIPLESSYSYELGQEPAPAGLSVLFDPRPRRTDATRRDITRAQQRYFGGRVPVVVCARHPEGKLNLTESGVIYRSRGNWEYEPASIAAALDRMARDLGTSGTVGFVRDWSVGAVLRFVEPRMASPLPPAVRRRMGEVADQLSETPSSDTADGELLHVAAWLHRGAQQPARARDDANVATTLLASHVPPDLRSLTAQLKADDGAVDGFIQAEMERQQIPGLSVAVLRDHQAILSRGFGLANVELKAAASPHTVYRLASVTKPFIAMALMMMVEEGKVSLDAPLRAYLPSVPASWNDVTVRHLVGMTSGIKNLYDLGIPWQNLRLDTTPDAILEKVTPLPLAFSPGARWHYSSTNYILLRQILERVSGRPIGDLLRDRIFRPLAMDETGVLDFHAIVPDRAARYTSRDGALLNADDWSPTWGTAGAELASTAADLVKWHAALDDGRLLSAASYREMWTPTHLVGRAPVRHFGLGWLFGSDRGHRTIWFSGGVPGASPNFTRYVEDQLTVIVLCNSDRPDAGVLAAGIARFFLPPPRAIDDPDPKRTSALLTLLQNLARGRAVAAHYSPEAYAQWTVDRVRTTAFYESLGPLRSMELVDRFEDGGGELRRYRVVFERAAILQDFRTEAGRVSDFSVSLE